MMFQGLVKARCQLSPQPRLWRWLRPLLRRSRFPRRRSTSPPRLRILSRHIGLAAGAGVVRGVGVGTVRGVGAMVGTARGVGAMVGTARGVGAMVGAARGVGAGVVRGVTVGVRSFR